MVRTNVTPPQIKALLPGGQHHPLGHHARAPLRRLHEGAIGRGLLNNNFAPLDSRYLPNNPSVAEGNGLFHLVQDQFTPHVIRSLLFRPPLTGGAILGNGSVIEIEAGARPRATAATPWWPPSTRSENSGGVAPTAVNSLTATSFLQTPLLQSAAADLQIRNATTTIRAEDGTLLASFAAGSIGLEQDDSMHFYAGFVFGG